MEERRKFGVSSMFFAFLCGSIVGAGVALLLAPQSGYETRRRIKGIAEDIKEKATEYADEVKEKIAKGIESEKEIISSVLSEGKDYIEKKRSILSSAIEAGKEAFEREKERLKSSDA